MIESFGDRATEDYFHGKNSARGRRLASQLPASALTKLDLLNAAAALDDLRSPPGNRLEALRGNYAGAHSIQINDQWRIVFRWSGSGAHAVQIVDYH